MKFYRIERSPFNWRGVLPGSDSVSGLMRGACKEERVAPEDGSDPLSRGLSEGIDQAIRSAARARGAISLCAWWLPKVRGMALVVSRTVTGSLAIPSPLPSSTMIL